MQENQFNNDNVLMLDATAQSQALKNGTLSSLKLTEIAIEQLTTQYSRMNAFLYIDHQGAIEAALASDQRRIKQQTYSAVDGLVIAIKDNIDVAGMPTTCGLGGIISTPDRDASVIVRLRKAGAIILGKLNMDEAAIGTGNKNPHYGQCFNPNFPKHVPGGSSGGSAASVASGICSMALGTDTMGSIRIPAACCGIIGLKPSADVISNEGLIPCSKSLDTIGPLCRSVRDLSLWWPHLSGEKMPEEKFDLSLIKVNFIDNMQECLALPNYIENVYKDFFIKLKASLASLTKIKIEKQNFTAIRLAGLISVEACLTREFNKIRTTHPEWLSNSLIKMLEWFEKQDEKTETNANKVIFNCGEWFKELLGNADILIMPTLTNDIPLLSENSPSNFADLTCLANMSGMPALNIIIGTDKNNLPISLQFIGQKGMDKKLIEITKIITKKINI